MKKLNMYQIVPIITLIISIGLVVAGFIIPPTGIVDGSVLTAVGEIGLFTCIFNIPYYIQKAKEISFKKGDLELEIKK